MLFQTVEFLVLLLGVMAGVAALRNARPQHALLLIASAVFYGWWDVRFLFLLFLSCGVDFVAALGIVGIGLSWRERLRLSATLVAATLLLLGVNWPALQRGDGAWNLATLVHPTWPGCRLAIGLSLGYALAAPFLYGAVIRLSEPARRRTFLILSLAVNLGVLAFFKYAGFFLDSLAGIGAFFGHRPEFPALRIALPVGISFYTFQTMSYTIDVYRRTIEPERSLLRFSLFVAYFPQLVAGPIIRPQQFLPALERAWTLRADRLTSGFHLALVGLLKKVLIADSIAPLVDNVLNAPQGRPSLVIQMAVALFAVQLYCDFSGYTDIARGVSRVFGVEIPLNFNYPYFATSMAEFWKRWHISLSTWIRDYLFFPLGGTRRSIGRVCLNLMIVMTLCGLWHGAGWSFVLWGALQGALLVLHRVIVAVIEPFPFVKRGLASRPGTVLRWATTQWCFLLGLCVFRVPHLGEMLPTIRAFAIPDGVLSISSFGLGASSPVTALLAFTSFWALHATGFALNRIDAWRTAAGTSGLPAIAEGRRWPDWLDLAPQPAARFGYAATGAILFFGWPAAAAPFIYFQF